jgi:hypothetical protein
VRAGGGSTLAKSFLQFVGPWCASWPQAASIQRSSIQQKITYPKAIGPSKTAWMIGCPEEQRSRSFASHPEHGKKKQRVALPPVRDTATLELL